MIHFLDSTHPEYIDLFFEAAQLEPISGAKLQILYHMFKLTYKEVSFWVQLNGLNQPVAGICRYGSQLYVSDSMNADLFELEEFIRFLGDFSVISCSPSLAMQLEDLGTVSYLHILIYPEKTPLEDDFSLVNRGPALPQIYDLLSIVDPRFEEQTSRGAWYTHTSHLVRHKLGFCSGIYDNKTLVSAGGVFASGKTHSVISELCTHPDYRGQGYAGLICRDLVNRILKTNKTPALYTNSESLCLYYNSMGFTQKNRWTVLENRN